MTGGGALRALKEILYPEGAICAGCGKISDGTPLCPACRRELEGGEVLESWSREDLDGLDAWSVRPHRGLARRLVLALKYGAESRAAAELTALLRSRPGLFPPFPAETVVTWVPMPKGRKRERCIDHGRLLAERTAKELGLDCRPLLIRRKAGWQQAGMTRARRQKNLRNAFAPVGEIGFPVLLVDDVLTTGTTARRCVEALRSAGAREITVLTMTRAIGSGG